MSPEFVTNFYDIKGGSLCFVQIKYVIVHSHRVVYYVSGTISLIPVEDAFMYLQILLLSFFIKSRFDTFGTSQM